VEAARIVAWRTPAGKGGSAGEGGGAGAGAAKAATAQPPAQLLTAAVLRLHGQPLRVRGPHLAAAVFVPLQLPGSVYGPLGWKGPGSLHS